ncbi:MAG: glycerate kinase, partial [Bryobacterales bacterium]|nr:glycerate kinase [Bryobacterales bacterium]
MTESPQTEHRMREAARRVFAAAVASASPRDAVLRHVRLRGETLIAGKRRYALRGIKHIWVTGAGKASAAMAQGVEAVLGKRIEGGAITVKYGHAAKLRHVAITEAGHPLPDEQGVSGAERIAAILAGAGPDDLVIAVISGGASALLVQPANGITLQEKQETTRLLLASGASIHEINAVRKHLSAIKGGRLARRAAPARVLALLLSDVIGDDLDVIGSGPAAPDASTFGDALGVIDRFRLRDRVPAAVRRRLESGARGEIAETPKPGDPLFERVQNLVVGSNAQAVRDAAHAARSLGYRPLVLTTSLDGEAREQARMLVAIAREAQKTARPARPPLCLLAGGETVVTLRGDGKGGRNQEFALAAALAARGMEGVCVLAGGTDGNDGPTDAAGAIITGGSVARGVALGLSAEEALANNDSYAYFSQSGELLHTGPTGTNVMDLYAA